VSIACRQHDTGFFYSNGQPVIPEALSWQWEADERFVHVLRHHNAEKIVGPPAARFLVPKAIEAFRLDRKLSKHTERVALTADWIGAMLTGKWATSESDGACNLLINQSRRQIARTWLDEVGLVSDLIAPVLPIGKALGMIGRPKNNNEWLEVANKLAGYTLVSPLGDNHAGGLSCGLDDEETLAISAGTSGTVYRLADSKVQVAGKAAHFAYHDGINLQPRRLLLSMLPDCCGSRWQSFLAEYQGEMDLAEFSELALEVEQNPEVQVYVPQHTSDFSGLPRWDRLSLPQKVASVFNSIAQDLIEVIDSMMVEVTDLGRPQITKAVITGGLFNSEYFLQLIKLHLEEIHGLTVFRSAKEGKLASKGEPLGALVNAAASSYDSLAAAIEDLCPIAKVG
jgi:sugar (pentulose or hexulose) kinase